MKILLIAVVGLFVIEMAAPAFAGQNCQTTCNRGYNGQQNCYTHCW